MVRRVSMFGFQHKPSILTLHYTSGKTTPNSALHSPQHSEYLPWSNLCSWVLQIGQVMNVSESSIYIRSNDPVLVDKNWNLARWPGRTVTYWSYWRLDVALYIVEQTEVYNTAKPIYDFSLYSNPVQLPLSAPRVGWVS